MGNSNAPEPSVTIGGPASIKPYASCTWFAVLLDEPDPPFTYSWSQSAGTGTGSGSSYESASASSFTLYVTVTDGNGHSATASRNVTVASNAGPCASGRRSGEEETSGGPGITSRARRSFPVFRGR